MFSGAKSGKKVENFIYNMEVYFQVAQVPTNEQAQTCIAYLIGDAKLWWTQAAPSLMTTYQNHQLAWADKNMKLKNNFY